MAERLTPERLEYARTSLHLAGNPLMWEVADHIDAQQAEIDRLRALLKEAREALESTGPCEPSGTKCSAHNYNRLPCEVAVVLAKLAQEGLS